jgi:hypothetical protein
MTINPIGNIYNNYRSVGEYSTDYTLDFFKKNAIAMNNPGTLENNNELKLYIELAWQHLNALYQKDRYNETADNAIKYLKVVDGKINQERMAFIKDNWYYGILLYNGMANYQLHDYRTSVSIFRQLTEQDSKNEHYKNWLAHSKYRQRLWISKTITVLCALLLLIEIFFKKYIPFVAGISLDSIALVGIVGTLIYDYYMNRSFRKSKIKH